MTRWTLTVVALVLALSAPASAQVLSDGHVDYAARMVDGRLRSLVKDGTGPGEPVWREPSSVVFSLGDAARLAIPANAAFLGRAGDPVWMIPQVQRPGVLWAGWNTQELSAAQFDGPLTWSLDLVDGPGDVTIFQTGVFGQADILFRSSDGLPDLRSLPLDTHAHGNWAFSREGAYRLTFTMRGRLQSGAEVQDTQTLPVTVTAGAAATPTPTPSATPTPGPAPGGTPRPSEPKPAVRALSARLRGRTLHLRLRLAVTSRVAVTVRRRSRVSAKAKPRTVAAGTRTVKLRLSRRPAAGRHSVRVAATAGGRTVTHSIALRSA